MGATRHQPSRGSVSQPVAARAPRTPKWRPRPLTLLRWGLLVLSLGLVVRFLHRGWPEVARAFSGLITAPAPLVGAAVGLEVVWMLCLAQVYRSALLSFGGEVRMRSALRITMSAFTLSRVLPGGGAAGSVFAARELVAVGNPVPLTVLSMVVSWWISMTALAVLVVAGTAPQPPSGRSPGPTWRSRRCCSPPSCWAASSPVDFSPAPGCNGE